MAEADGGGVGNAERAAPTVRTGAFLERDRELAVLEEAVPDAAVGRAVLVVVEGPAGIGKSRLLSEARVRAAGAGFRILSARASGLEGLSRPAPVSAAWGISGRGTRRERPPRGKG
jgi:hypothetical protein